MSLTKATDLNDPMVLAAADAAYWARLSRIKLQASEWALKKREFQLKPMMSTARRRCYMKGTQLGVTEFETVLKTLHGMIYKYYPRGVLVLFPTSDNVQEFSKSRFNPIILNNRGTIGRFVKPGGKGTDTASLKKIHEAFLYLRGARLSQSIGLGGDAKESANLRSAPVDCVKFEEVDLIDSDAVTKAIMRMGDSEVGEEVYISNPTLPEYGIDALFQKSDQQYWYKRCSCGEWSCPEKTFPECVQIRPNCTGYVACSKCGKDIGPHSMTKGEWVADLPSNTSYMEGYRLSQLMSAARINDPAEILDNYLNPPQGNLGDIYRLRLGLPYVAAEDRLSQGAVHECCSTDMMPMAHAGPCAMGVDIGKTMHVVIGPRTGNDRFNLVKIIRVKSWDEIHDLIGRYNVTSGVIDIRPYEDGARTFQKAERSRCRIFLCEYNENTIQGINFNDDSGIVKVNRTEICDRSHRIVSEKKVSLPRRCDEVDIFTKHCCNLAKVAETNKKSGGMIYRYRAIGSGGDHYRHALNYYLLASSGSRIVNINSPNLGQEIAESEYSVV